MELIPAKTIITRTARPDSWFGSDYNMNIYRGCSHGCIYCDSRSDCYRVVNFSKVAAKENALDIIEKELKSKRKKGIVGTGAMSDPYNPMEGQHGLTRGALELLDAYGFGVYITTKSDLILRDMDILKRINRHSPVGIGVTITAAEDGLCGKLEPGAPPSSKRFAAIRSLTENGFYAGILMMPVLPFISDSLENIQALVQLASEKGARFIYPWFGMSLRSGQREYFYRCLDRLYPGLKQRYMQAYGNAYQCRCPEADKLSTAFINACTGKGIAHRMTDIVQGIRSSAQSGQMLLFEPG